MDHKWRATDERYIEKFQSIVHVFSFLFLLYGILLKIFFGGWKVNR